MTIGIDWDEEEAAQKALTVEKKTVQESSGKGIPAVLKDTTPSSAGGLASVPPSVSTPVSTSTPMVNQAAQAGGSHIAGQARQRDAVDHLAGLVEVHDLPDVRVIFYMQDVGFAALRLMHGVGKLGDQTILVYRLAQPVNHREAAIDFRTPLLGPGRNHDDG